MKTKTIFLFIPFLLGISACKKNKIPDPGPNDVFLEYKAFNPTQLTVAVGTTVTFTNQDNDDHTATSTGNFDSGKLKHGNIFKYTFNTPGIYYFYCNFHTSNSAEQGAIKVQ